MKKFVLALLVGTIALAPVLAAAQTGSGSGGSKPGTSSPSGTTGGSPSSDPTHKTPGSSSGSSGSMGTGTGAPSASPSGMNMSTFKTQPDCEKAGGMWQASSSSCTRK